MYKPVWQDRGGTNFVAYRDGVWHERVTVRVNRITEKSRPIKPVQNRGIDVLAYSIDECN